MTTTPHDLWWSAPRRPGDGPEAADCERLRAQGLLRPLLADVLVAADTPDTAAVRAAALAVLLNPAQLRDGVVGHVTAAWLHAGAAVRDVAAPEPVVLLVPYLRSKPQPRPVAQRQARLRPGEECVVEGVRITSPVRTAADVARVLPVPQAVQLVRLLEGSGVGPDDVVACLGAQRRPRGAVRAREVLARWTAIRDGGEPLTPQASTRRPVTR